MNKFKKVVVIDDDPISLLICERIIKKYNFSDKVTAFKNGVDALNYLKNSNIEDEHLILLDINMPDYSGWDFLDDFDQMMRHHEKNIIIAMLSSTFDPYDFEKANSYSSVNNFFTKPLTVENLFSLIEPSQDAMVNSQ